LKGTARARGYRFQTATELESCATTLRADEPFIIGRFSSTDTPITPAPRCRRWI
jgi:hypothetical protein